MQSRPIKDYFKERKKRTIWYRIVACLAVLVVMGTGYTLILPAVTMEQQAAVSDDARETEAEWEATLPGSLTGDWGTDLAAAAESQIGYSESSTDTIVNDAGEISGYTRYGAWYGDEYGEWNGMFLAFCLHYAEVPEDAVSADADTAETLRFVQEKGFYKEAGQYEPEVGDIAFLPDAQTGVVTEASSEGVSVAAGDIDGTVAVIENAEPLGYGSMETAAALYAEAEAGGRPADEGGDADPGQSGDTTGGTPGGDDGLSADGGEDSEIQSDQEAGGEESQPPERETEEQAVQPLKEYVLSRGFGNEEASFIESLKDSDGQEIEPEDDGKYHIYEDEGYTWSISLYAPAGIPEAGTYVYEMPVGMSATDVQPRDITANDGTVIGHFSIGTDGSSVVVEMLENTKIRLRVKFDISMEIQTDNGEPINGDIVFIPRESSDEGTIEKTAQVNSDGQIEWTITANIPGWDENSEYSSWYIRDIVVSPGTAYPDLSKGEIEISYGGTIQPVHSCDQASDNEDLAYYWDPGDVAEDMTSDHPPRLYFVTRRSQHQCEDNEGETPEGLPPEWCTHWTLTEDSVITIKYLYPEDSDDFNLEDLEGGRIYNTVLLNEKGPFVSFDLPEVIQKSGDGGKFSITFNQGLMDLSKMDQIVINDVMSDNLFYMLGSINVTATDEDGVVQVLTYGEDYTLETVDEDGSPDLHHLKITILHPGQYKYQITYQVTAESGSGDEPYNNTVSVDIWGNHFEDDESGTISFSSAAEEYVLSIHKTDIDDPNRVVPGASYGIYSSQGELLAEETTDENGIAHFRGDPAAGFILASDQLYYLQETAAPEGYQLSETRYWFYYSDSDQEEINRLIETAKAVGIYRDEDGDAQAVPNHGYTNEPIEGSSETAEPIEVTDQRIWYELPETGSTGTIMYTIAGLLLTGSVVTALYREKCKKRRNK